uniref:Uncharacterized protein n=1 Tax=Quercus lobata TaxID=97700 RepID=A0A7N2N7C3_QUELO
MLSAVVVPPLPSKSASCRTPEDCLATPLLASFLMARMGCCKAAALVGLEEPDTPIALSLRGRLWAAAAVCRKVGGSCNWNEYNLNPLTRNNWRASLVPAAAVIPAPIAYIKVVAVKKLVVEPWAWLAGPPHRVYWSGRAFPSGEPHALHWACRGTRTFTLKKLECSKQAFARIH